MKTMQRRGCVDSTLTQRAEQLLSDTALQDYAAAFTSGSNTDTQDYGARFTTGFILTSQTYTNKSAPDQTCSAVSPSALKQHHQGFCESGIKPRDLKSESTTHLHDSSSEVKKKNAISPVPTSPVREHGDIRVSSPAVPTKEGLSTKTTKVI